jgi:hypothetical protein
MGEKYDVFISYRWGPYGSLFVQSVFDRFGFFTVGENAREVDVFLNRLGKCSRQRLLVH